MLVQKSNYFNSADRTKKMDQSAEGEMLLMQKKPKKKLTYVYFSN